MDAGAWGRDFVSDGREEILDFYCILYGGIAFSEVRGKGGGIRRVDELFARIRWDCEDLCQAGAWLL